MPDAPDGYKYRPAGDRAVLGDLGELAVRLGSIVSYDRKGDVIWMWNGSTGLSTWAVSYDVGVTSAELGTTYANVGGYHIKMDVAGATDPHVQLIKFFSPVEVSRWGLEVSVAFLSDYKSFFIIISRETATLRHRAYILFDFVANEIQVKDEDEGFVKVVDLPDLVNAYGQFHNMKLVADFDTNKYVSFQINADKYDLSEYSLEEDTATDMPMQKVIINLDGRDGESDYGYLDYVIVTTGEP